LTGEQRPHGVSQNPADFSPKTGDNLSATRFWWAFSAGIVEATSSPLAGRWLVLRKSKNVFDFFLLIGRQVDDESCMNVVIHAVR
jgi:hypothetical protein